MRAVRNHSGPSRRDRGQAAVLMVGALALTGALIVGLVHLAATVAGREQAQAAADAAALAGVAGGAAAATAAAADNGAEVVALRWEGDDVVVVVRVHVGDGPWQRTVTAVARATRAP